MLLKPASPRSRAPSSGPGPVYEEIGPVPDQVVEPEDPQLVALLDRYMAAFNNADPAGLETLLLEEATIEAPPFPTWFQGRRTCVRYLANLVSGGDYRMLATRANGQLAAAAYRRNPQGNYEAFGISVLEVTADGIGSVVAFCDPALVARFGLPVVHPGP